MIRGIESPVRAAGYTGGVEKDVAVSFRSDLFEVK
jgi:hypothetical protein